VFKFNFPRKEKEMFNILGYHAVKKIRFSACAGRWVGQRGQGKSRGLYSSVEKEMKIMIWEQDFCTPQNIIST